MTTGNTPDTRISRVILPAVGGGSPCPFSSRLLLAFTMWTFTFITESLLSLENTISGSTLSGSCALTRGEGRTYQGAESRVIRALLKAGQGYGVFFHLQKCHSFSASEKQHGEQPPLARMGSALGRMKVQPHFPILGL